MKKALLSFLMILILLCYGCSQPQIILPPLPPTVPEANIPPTQQPSLEQEIIDPSATPSVTPLLEDYLSELAILDSPVRQYGESASHIRMEEDLVVHILYPEGELPALDQAVDAWVSDTVAYYETEAVDNSAADDAGDAAELLVDYCSYLIAEKFVSVKLTGMFDRPYMAHPVDLSATFVASLETGEVLSLSELLLPGGQETLCTMVATDAGVDEASMDDALLNHWLLMPNGLEITLVRGEYLPMSDGTVSLLYPYEDLHDILSLSDHSSTEPVQPDESPAETTPETPEDLPPAATFDPSKPMLALTFDDGPSAHTERLLDAFAAHGGKGTFYVVGNMIDNRPDALIRMATEGHEIGGHSWDHRQLTKLGTQELTDQIMNTRAKIYDVSGIDATTMRPPYGSYNDQVKAVCKELGIVMVNWSVDTLDWKHKNADTVYNAVMDEAKDGAIILCHDLHKTTVEAMERAIPDLIAQGYQLVTVSELLSCSEKTIEAGSVYFKR